MPNKTTPAKTVKVRFAAAKTFAVDPTTGSLTNLVLLQAGREALGHGLYIDDETLATAQACIATDGGRLKGYVTHNHGGPCSWSSPDMDEASSELAIPGFFSGFSIKSKQLVAASFEFYAAFKKNYTPQFEQLLEMAMKTPDLLGLSIEASGYAVWVGKDGTEYGMRPENVDILYDGLPAFRITDVFAAAFVSDPAATDGLFARLSRVFGGKRPPTDRAELAAALSKFAAEFAAEANTVPLPANSVPTANPVPTDSHLLTMKIIETIKAEFGAIPAKFSQAMTILGNKPDITIEALRADMVQADLAAERAEVTTLKANHAALTIERDTLKASVVTLTAERDDFKSKFEAIKSSGAAPAVALGAQSTGAGVENPWAAGSLNYTAQATMLRTNPTLAASMQAAAKAAPAKK